VGDGVLGGIAGDLVIDGGANQTGDTLSLNGAGQTTRTAGGITQDTITGLGMTGQVVYAAFHLIGDFFRGAEGQYDLTVAPRTPKGDVPAKLPLEFSGIHPSCRDLHRVHGIHPHLDEVGHQGRDGSIGVQQDVRIAPRFGEPKELLMMRLDHPAIQ